MIREITLATVLLAASVSDMRTRRVSNACLACVLACCLIPPVRVFPLGVLAALPLFMAGVTCGGIGGGDVKLVAAIGAVLGFRATIYATATAMALLVAFHGLRRSLGREGASYPLVPFLFVGTAAGLLFG